VISPTIGVRASLLPMFLLELPQSHSIPHYKICLSHLVLLLNHVALISKPKRIVYDSSHDTCTRNSNGNCLHINHSRHLLLSYQIPLQLNEFLSLTQMSTCFRTKSTIFSAQSSRYSSPLPASPLRESPSAPFFVMALMP